MALRFDIFYKFVDVKRAKFMSKAGYIILSVAMSLLLSCGGRGAQSASQGSSEDARHYEFRFPQMPALLQGEAAKSYMRTHLWDNFDFEDTVQLSHLNRKEMERVFSIYVATIPAAEAGPYMAQLMRRASVSKPMFDYFLSLAEAVLHEPNSLERDDEKYIAVLEVALASDLLDEYEKMPYIHDMRMASQNRVGHRANDFTYTTADGRSGQMWALTADYTLIFISNPDCPMCRTVKEQIACSSLLSALISDGRLKVLVIYPDEDLTLWREHVGDYPKEWINAYDKGCVLSREELYDLKAIPALYLLDKEKRVLVKDSTDVVCIENIITQLN